VTGEEMRFEILRRAISMTSAVLELGMSTRTLHQYFHGRPMLPQHREKWRLFCERHEPYDLEEGKRYPYKGRTADMEATWDGEKWLLHRSGKWQAREESFAEMSHKCRVEDNCPVADKASQLRWLIERYNAVIDDPFAVIERRAEIVADLKARLPVLERQLKHEEQRRMRG